MKKLVGIGLLVLLSLSIKAQDTLYTRDGNIINAKIMEITQSTVSYRKASNPDGPLYTSDKSDVIFIHYRNGSKDVFTTNDNPNNTNATADNSSVNNQQPQTTNNYYPAQRPGVNVVVAPPIMAAPFFGGGWGGYGYYGGGWGRPYYRSSYYYRPHSYYHHHGWH